MQRLLHWWPSSRLPILGLLLLLVMLSLPLQAQVERERPSIPLTASQQARYSAMLPNLRCMVCQNESLAASQAPLAVDLRYQIRGLLAKGDSDAQVKQYLVDRYGQYVLYKPRFEPSTWLLWLGPLLLLMIAIFIALRLLRRRSRAVLASSDVDAAALKRLLEDDR